MLYDLVLFQLFVIYISYAYLSIFHINLYVNIFNIISFKFEISLTIISIVFFNVYVFDLCLCVYSMYCLCMIATIPLATGNKLNCFISARGMFTIVWHCALVLLFCCSLIVVFFVDFYMLINHLLKNISLTYSIY